MHASSAGIGRRPGLDAELAQLDGDGYTAARVLAQHRGRWLVCDGADDAPPQLVAARGRLRTTGGSPTTGDWVAIDGDGVIAAVLERRGTVVRRAAGAPVAGQVLAANVDLVLVVEPLPEPNQRRAERIVALAASGGVPAALVLTKADLADDGAAAAASGMARELGLREGVAVSAHDPESLTLLWSLLEPGATSVLLGPSGAGKSTLVNALLGVDHQATGEVSEHNDGRGRHTTVTRDLLRMPNGALLIDTPGIREAGLWDGGGVGRSFADIEELAARCRFSDCRHDGEPGCAVRADGDPDRVAAWRKLEREQEWIEDRRAASLARERRGRSHNVGQRGARRAKGER